MTDHQMLQAILERIAVIDRRIDDGFKEVGEKIENLDNKLTKRIDRLGEDIAYLEDDAPTVAEFNKLEKKVKKIEIKLAV